MVLGLPMVFTIAAETNCSGTRESFHDGLKQKKEIKFLNLPIRQVLLQEHLFPPAQTPFLWPRGGASVCCTHESPPGSPQPVSGCASRAASSAK